MKLCKFIVMLMLLFIVSCSTPTIQFDEGVRKLAYNILDNPDKLMDIEANYPEFYDKSVLLWTMQDTNIIKKDIDNIKGKLRPGFFGYCLEERVRTCQWYDIAALYNGSKLNIDTAKYKIIQYSFRKFFQGKRRGLTLYLLDRDSKFYLIDARYVMEGLH